MAEANPVYEISADNNADDVIILEQLLTGGEIESGECLALLENLSDESGTGAIVDSGMLDAVVSEMCGNPEEPRKKYTYLTHPPVAKKGPITSFCSLVGGKFNKEPEQMVSSETGDSRLANHTNASITYSHRPSRTLRGNPDSHTRLLQRHNSRGDSGLPHSHNRTRRRQDWFYWLLPAPRYEVLEESGQAHQGSRVPLCLSGLGPAGRGSPVCVQVTRRCSLIAL